LIVSKNSLKLWTFSPEWFIPRFVRRVQSPTVPFEPLEPPEPPEPLEPPEPFEPFEPSFNVRVFELPMDLIAKGIFFGTVGALYPTGLKKNVIFLCHISKKYIIIHKYKY